MEELGCHRCSTRYFLEVVIPVTGGTIRAMHILPRHNVVAKLATVTAPF
jgi:hypothetical protein